MFVSTEATILHADLDAFFASVEQRDDPSLRGLPVIVGAGVVLAASYEAKAYGIRTAMGGAQARRLCPQAIVVPPRMFAYSEASKAVFEVFEDTTPLVEGLSIDEAFLDVRGLQRLAGRPPEIAGSGERGSRAGRSPHHRRDRQDESSSPRSRAAWPSRTVSCSWIRTATRVSPSAPRGTVVGRRPGDSYEAARSRHHERRPGRTARRGGAHRDARAGLRPAFARPGAQPGSACRPRGASPPLDRVSARSGADLDRWTTSMRSSSGSSIVLLAGCAGPVESVVPSC